MSWAGGGINPLFLHSHVRRERAPSDEPDILFQHQLPTLLAVYAPESPSFFASILFEDIGLIAFVAKHCPQCDCLLWWAGSFKKTNVEKLYLNSPPTAGTSTVTFAGCSTAIFRIVLLFLVLVYKRHFNGIFGRSHPHLLHYGKHCLVLLGRCLRQRGF